MPNGVFPVPQFHSDPTPRIRSHPGVLARLWTRSLRNTLDRQLAAGANHRSSTRLELRAAQLGSVGGRSRLADALVEALGDARGPNDGASRTRSRRQHALIQDASDDLLALVLRLRENRPIEIRGAARVALLLNDSRSPLHREGGPDLRDAVRAAHTALDTPDSATQDLAPAA